MLLATKANKVSDVRKQSCDYNLIATTWHESGHVICALSNFLYVYSVNVMDLKDTFGYTGYDIYEVQSLEDEELKKILLISEVQTLYAGLIAEKLYYKNICGSDAFPMHLKISSSEDTKTAASIIRNNSLAKPGRQTYVFKKQMKDDVERFLTDHWDAVRVVAHALYKKVRLSHNDLKYLLTRKTNNPEFWKDKFKKLKMVHNDKVPPSEGEIKEILLENVIYTL